MKRIGPIFLHFLTVLSLLMCAATIVLWMRSMNRWEYFLHAFYPAQIPAKDPPGVEDGVCPGD